MELWLLISAFCFVLCLCVEEDTKKGVITGLGIVFLPILLPLGVIYVVVNALRGK